MSDQLHNPADRIKVTHLVTGLVFLGVAGTWAMRASGLIDSVALGVVLPLVLIVAGVLGLVAMVAGRAGRRSKSTATQIPTNDSEDVR